MIRFDKALRVWGTPDFEAVLKQELIHSADHLPLQQGLTHGNYVTGDPITVAINSVAETDDAICIKAGIFYQGVIGGCSCADDPTPVSESSEYCAVKLDIDKTTAATVVTLLSEYTERTD
jgi:hypothetical protein